MIFDKVAKGPGITGAFCYLVGNGVASQRRETEYPSRDGLWRVARGWESGLAESAWGRLPVDGPVALIGGSYRNQGPTKDWH